MPAARGLIPAGLLSLGTALALSGCSGSTTSSIPVTPSVTVSGSGQVRLGGSDQFTATVVGESSTAVTWQVNGVAGGNSTVGTISVTGFYVPPAAIPSPNTVTVKAVSVAAPTISGSASETVLNPIPSVTSAQVTQQYQATNGLVDVMGTNFVSGAVLQVAGTNVTTTFVSSTELQATVPISTGTTSLAVDVVNPNPGTATSTVANVQVTTLKASLPMAARLLDQATFGPTLTDIQHVETVGLQGYLNEQFAMAPTLEPDIATTPPTLCATNTVPCEQAEWWQNSLTAPDQLRQRVAFALSEMFVISTNSVNARAVTPYQNVLLKDAFGNFLTVMNDVTLSTGMGDYLDMLNSAKAPTGQIPNENYPRELMQLFTIGLSMLNQDGTQQLDSSGNPIPTYTEAQVQAFAKAYTGWTYATSTGGSPTKFPNNTPNYGAPMAAVETSHDMTAKTLLNGTVLPAGQTAEQDLAGALSNIFNHPNVGPFVCRQLIQHLVTSNPSPAYVARISAVFANDGSGTRGNLKAVINAILMDQEARAGDSDATFNGGHLREPMLYMTGVMRGLGFTFTGGGTGTGTEYYYTPGNYTTKLVETPSSTKPTVSIAEAYG